MTQEEIKIQCLNMAYGSLSEAKRLYEWVSGMEQPAPMTSKQSANPYPVQYAGQQSTGDESMRVWG